MNGHAISKISILISALTLTAACSPMGADITQETGSERMTWTNSGVIFKSAGSMGLSNGVSSMAVTVPLTLTQVANLTPPTVGLSQVQANDIFVSGTKAYVSYNVAGSGYSGGIDVIDFATPAAPVLTSSASYAYADINGVYRLGSYLYAVGARDTDQPGVLYRYALNGSGDLTATRDEVTLPSYAGTDVVASSSYIYATSGDNGGLTVLNTADLTQAAYTPIANARAVDLSALGITIATGKTATTEPKVLQLNILGLLNNTSPDLTGATIDGAKSSVSGGLLLNLATAGVGGTYLMCQATGAVAVNIPIPASATLPAAVRASNAATFGNGLIYVANGAAGINVYAVEPSLNLANLCQVTVSFQGNISFEDGASVNNVVWASNKLIVATGLGGFRVINVNQGLVLGLLGAL